MAIARKFDAAGCWPGGRCEWIKPACSRKSTTTGSEGASEDNAGLSLLCVLPGAGVYRRFFHPLGVRTRERSRLVCLFLHGDLFLEPMMIHFDRNGEL
jgi:hypothetical protein